MGPCEHIDPLLCENEYTEEEKLLRQAFVQEYMKTRNAYQACIALGFLSAYASDWAKTFMEDGYVRRLILEAERQEDSVEAALERKRKYRAWMEVQATYYGPGASHSSRVSAIAHLMRIEGMDAPEPEEKREEHAGGVMVVPALTNADSWSTVAANSQNLLKQTVKE